MEDVGEEGVAGLGWEAVQAPLEVLAALDVRASDVRSTGGLDRSRSGLRRDLASWSAQQHESCFSCSTPPWSSCKFHPCGMLAQTMLDLWAVVVFVFIACACIRVGTMNLSLEEAFVLMQYIDVSVLDVSLPSGLQQVTFGRCF